MQFPCRSHAALCRGLERSLSERHGRGMTGERHGVCELAFTFGLFNHLQPTKSIYMVPVQGLKLNRRSKSGLEPEIPVTACIIYVQICIYICANLFFVQ
jgi:hypothetical protein